MEFTKLCKQLETKLVQSYEQGVTMNEAEKLAGEFLHAQIAVSSELKKADLDSRMRKSGVKAIKAAIYLEHATKDAKKPSDMMLQAYVDSNPLVDGEQKEYDKSEAEKDELDRYYNIFREAHIYFRGISKGRFE